MYRGRSFLLATSCVVLARFDTIARLETQAIDACTGRGSRVHGASTMGGTTMPERLSSITPARLPPLYQVRYNDAHHYRAENPLSHLHEDEAPVRARSDKLSFCFVAIEETTKPKKGKGDI